MLPGATTMGDAINRRRFLGVATATGFATGLAGSPATAPPEARGADSAPRSARPFLTDAGDFFNVSRGTPKPYTLEGEDLIKARLTSDSWRLEIIGDGSSNVA